MASLDDINDVTAAFLVAAVDALNLTDAGAPGRAYTNSGRPAMDCCLPGESLISTESGPRPISEVRPGDRVWAQEDGSLVLRSVVRHLAKGAKPLVRVRSNRRSVLATDDHKLLRLRSSPKTRSAAGTFISTEWDTEWVEARELQAGDILVSLNELRTESADVSLPDGTPIDHDLAWLLGLWIGDGCFNQDVGLCFFVHNGVRNRAAEVIHKTWGITVREDSERLNLNSHELCAVFEEVVTRSHAAEKKVPGLIWDCEPQIRRAFLDGYAAADGHTTRLGYRRYDSTSRRLVAEVRMMHVELGDGVSNISVQHRTRPISIKGRTIASALPLYRFAYYPESRRFNSHILETRGARRALPDDQLGVTVVRDVQAAGSAETFDLQIERAHNFVADGLVVHNCGQVVCWASALGDAESLTSIGGLAGSTRTKKLGAVPVLTVFIQATRCAPTPEGEGGKVKLPSPEELAAVSRMTNQDAWALWNHVNYELKHGLLAKVCSGAWRDGLTAVDGQGGCVGWEIVYRYPIDGGYPFALET